MARLDRVLFNNDWEEIYLISDLLALSSNVSDHWPLLLSCAAGRPRVCRFHFENFWCKLPGFLEIVKGACEEEVDSTDPAKVLSIKLQRTAKALRSWGQKKQNTLRMQFQIANDVILRLDTTQETRGLSLEERRLKAFLKGKCLALAALERVRLRHRARVRGMQEGNANSKYFHLKANGRRRKHLIPYLKVGSGTATYMEDKLNMARDFFSNLMGSTKSPGCSLRLEALGLSRLSPEMAHGLEVPFTEEKIKHVIWDMLTDRAPGPDGFSGLFFRTCWEIIAKDFMVVMKMLFERRFYSFGALNSSILTLLPKNEDPLQLSDFRPTNLIHGAAKFFAKALATRLAALLPSLISQAQSAFVSKRSIHENFKFVRNAARTLRQKKKQAVMMKIDISKAFDTLSWSFLIEVLRARGFGERWCSWICGLLSMASTSILINGGLSLPFTLGQGVRQGDPLSPALFILAMDTLHGMLQCAVHR